MDMSQVTPSTPLRIILTDERRERVKLLSINPKTQGLEEVLHACTKEMPSSKNDDSKEEVGLFLLCDTSESAYMSKLEHISQIRDSDTVILSKVTQHKPFLVEKSEISQSIIPHDSWWEPRMKQTGLDTVVFVPTTFKINIKRVVDVDDSIQFTITAVQQCFPRHFLDRPFQLHLNHQGLSVDPDSTNSLKLSLADGRTENGITAVYRFPLIVQTRRIWDHWPFVVCKAEISMQANSANKDGVSVRPTLSFIPKNIDQMCRFNIEETSVNWDFISTKPWITVESQERQNTVENKRIQFTYFLSRTWVYSLINIMGPLATITAVSFLNYYSNKDPYYEIQSSLILAIAFVIPQVIAIRERGNKLFENDYYIILLLLSYAITMYPDVRTVQLIGNILLVACNLFPIVGYIRYRRFTSAIRRSLETAPWARHSDEPYTSDVELMKQAGYIGIDDPQQSVFHKQVAHANKVTLDAARGSESRKGRLHFPEGITQVLKNKRGFD
eukprot:c7055_g1_i1.p1 GENE.c7055_g1_i1~~c7055_g1_i1.p1  ORF type:complete len:499 (-),score=92.09 c7055_g1_i1:96-1592(-)